MVTILFFLSSGLFLGWSLGANDAANVFGTAVGTKMLKFKTAALVCSIFLTIGAVVGGAGTTHTLGKLGAVNALAGSFTVALAAATTVFMMTKLSLPVSTSQAIVGAIVGWNFFTGSLTNYNSLMKIVSTWIICPLLAGFFSFILYHLFAFILNRAKIHLFRMDAYTRWGLLLIGAFGSYSLGANNIANVMGVFVPADPFKDISILGLFHFTGAQQLFLLGGIAISVGVFTYSQKVMRTVGKDVFKLSPLAALVIVLAESLVLYLFASENLEAWLISHGLPSFPLVPVSSSQAVVGGVLGIGLARGIRNVNTKILGGIGCGWITTPIASGILCFIALFFVQNVFGQIVNREVPYIISDFVMEKLENSDINTESLEKIKGKKFNAAAQFKRAIQNTDGYTAKEIQEILTYSEINFMNINMSKIGGQINSTWLSEEQIKAIQNLDGEAFVHKWQLQEALQEETDKWKFKKNIKQNKAYNKKLEEKYVILYNILRQPFNF